MFRNLRNAFIGGLLLLLPLGVTTIVVTFLMDKIGTPTSRLFFWFLSDAARKHPCIDPLLSVAAILIGVAMITLLGLLSNYFLGKFVVRSTERLIDILPFINTVYKTVKQIVSTFTKHNRSVFQKVVIVEYPRKGTYGLGFLTGIATGETKIKIGQRIAYVFVPTTPNPTSGYLLMIPEQDVINLDMSIADGMKLIISGGAVEPVYTPDEK